MAAPRTPILDDFKRGNTGPSPSSSWTNGILTFTGGLVVVNNQATQESGGAYRQGSYWNTAFTANQEVFCTCVFGTLAANDGISLYTRLANVGSGTTDGYELEVMYNGSSFDWSLIRVDNGSTPLLTTGSQTVATGNKVMLQAYGSTISALLYSGGTWTQVLSASDANYSAGGFVGAEVLGSQNWRIDDFGGGSYPAAGQENVTIR